MTNEQIWGNYRRHLPTQSPSSAKLIERNIEYTWVGCFDNLRDAVAVVKKFKADNKQEKIKSRVKSTIFNSRGARKIYSFNLYIFIA